MKKRKETSSKKAKLAQNIPNPREVVDREVNRVTNPVGLILINKKDAMDEEEDAEAGVHMAEDPSPLAPPKDPEPVIAGMSTGPTDAPHARYNAMLAILRNNLYMCVLRSRHAIDS